MGENLVCVKTFENRKDAEVAQGLLEQYEINSDVQAEDSGSMRPHLAVGAKARLMVEENKSEKAKKVLEA